VKGSLLILVRNRKSKWEEIADQLKMRIIDGELEPGQEFPTTVELMKEFNVYAGTIQQAVNRLIQEGLVISFGSGSSKRIVRHIVNRSTRYCNKTTEELQEQSVLKIKIIDTELDLPNFIKELMNPPVLLYITLKKRDGIPVEIRRSYVPSLFPLEILKDILVNPKHELHKVMQSFNQNPYKCQEAIYIDSANDEECEKLSLSTVGNVIVVKIKRKVYSKDDELLEYSLLTNRVDAYEYVYDYYLNSP